MKLIQYSARRLACKALISMMTLAALQAPAAHAEELLIWSAGAVKAAMIELVPSYQTSTGNTVKVEYAPVGTLMKRLSDGGKPDVVILSQDVSAEAEKLGWTAPAASTPIANVGIGIAIREGAPEPDISSADALRTTLLNAKSITYIDPTKGTSGKHFVQVLEQLGIAQQMKAKTTLGESGYVVEPVARGEVELGLQQITEILPVKGVKLLGPLPPPFQKTTTYTIAVASSARSVLAAQNFKQYILSPASLAVFRNKGFSIPLQ